MYLKHGQWSNTNPVTPDSLAKHLESWSRISIFARLPHNGLPFHHSRNSCQIQSCHFGSKEGWELIHSHFDLIQHSMFRRRQWQTLNPSDHQPSVCHPYVRASASRALLVQEYGSFVIGQFIVGQQWNSCRQSTHWGDDGPHSRPIPAKSFRWLVGTRRIRHLEDTFRVLVGYTLLGFL